MLDKIRDFLTGADAPTEDQSERDGVLSYSKEWHSLAAGAGAGAVAAVLGEPAIAAGVVAVALGVRAGRARLSTTIRREITSEPWYCVFGVALGYLVGGAILVFGV